MDKVTDFIKDGDATTEKALEVYDDLEPVDLSSMSGRWKGRGVPTGHRFDGLLERAGWYGKQFIDRNRAHPLLFNTSDQKEWFAVDPKFIPLWFTYPNSRLLSRMVQLARPLLETSDPKARLRMVKYRGKLSAAMIYDNKPIIDCFRRVNKNTVMGAMDLKGNTNPYFFLLEHDDTEYEMPI